MPTDTKLDSLVINYLTQEQYDAISSPNENELYLTPDKETHHHTLTIKDGDITLKSSKIVIDGDLYPSNGQGSEKGWTGNVVFVDGSSLKFQNGILVGGQVADLVTMS